MPNQSQEQADCRGLLPWLPLISGMKLQAFVVNCGIVFSVRK